MDILFDLIFVWKSFLERNTEKRYENEPQILFKFFYYG